MAKVRMHAPADTKNAEALRSLLLDADCEIVGSDDQDIFVPTDASDDGIGCPPPLVVLLPEDGTADAAFDQAVLKAVQAGCRVIGVWPSNGGGGVPACLDDYGGDTVPWITARIRLAVVGTPQHRGANDDEAEAPDTKRHVCK